MNYEYCNGRTYTVKKGDTLYGVSRKCQVPLEKILQANPYVDVYNLQIGDTLCIPEKMSGEGCMGVPTATISSLSSLMDTGNAKENSAEITWDTTIPEETQTEDVTEPPKEISEPEGDLTGQENSCRFVTEQGETMASLLKKANVSLEEFLRYTSWEHVYLLPGIAYRIPREKQVE